MTIKERVMHCVENLDCEKDNIEKLVALAYFIGKEEATKNVSDAVKALIVISPREGGQSKKI